MSRKQVTVLGCGLVGGPIAADLVSDFDVVAVDVNPVNLSKLRHINGIKTITADLADYENLAFVVKGSDYVVNAVPGFMGFKTLKTLLERGFKVVDIAFMPEDAMQLDGMARQYGAIAITDMGVAPGMSNLLAGYASTRLERFDKLEIFVGGLPKVREWPWEYKAVFSPADVLEEYTRPARLMQHGRIITRPALSEPELITFDKVGTLEAFNSDGLRSLLYTLKVPDMVEKTMRYPGHARLMEIFRHAGFFDTNEITISGKQIVPLEVTSALLFNQWKLGEADEDITLMRVKATGMSNGKPICLEWELFDEYDPVTRVHSMARTTGYAGTAALRLLDAGFVTSPGLYVPEMIGKDEACVQFMLADQRKKGIIYNEKSS